MQTILNVTQFYHIYLQVMWNAAFVKETLHDAQQFGFELGEVKFSWPTLKTRRDAYIKRLNGIYERLLEKSGVSFISGTGKLVAPHTVEVAGKQYTAEHVVVAVGGYPRPSKLPGAEHCINSDGFFDLEDLPAEVAVIGGGYIAVEMAGMLNTLGSKVTIFARSGLLSKFDSMLREKLTAEYEKAGITIVAGSKLAGVTKSEAGKLTLTYSTEEGEQQLSNLDTVLMAIGRDPATSSLGLDSVGIKTSESGHIQINDWDTHETHAAKHYALGDVVGLADLTPVAIAVGRTLADRLFGDRPNGKFSYDLIPTVVFSHPTIATVGLTEGEAKEKYGEDAVKVWNSTFVNLYYGTFQVEPSDKPKTYYKMLTVGEDQRVVGVHMLGMASDEVMQGFGVAIKMGATKADLDACVAIHPTAGEEMVTFQPWNPDGARAPGLPAGK